MSAPDNPSKDEVDRQFSGPQSVTTAPEGREARVYDKGQRRDTALARYILPFVLLGLFLALMVWVLAVV